MKRLKCFRAPLRVLITLALFSKTLLAQVPLPGGTPGGVPLAVDAFNQKLTATPQGQLLDVRTPAEYAQGHLAQSQNLDIKDPVFCPKTSHAGQRQTRFCLLPVGRAERTGG